MMMIVHHFHLHQFYSIQKRKKKDNDVLFILIKYDYKGHLILIMTSQAVVGKKNLSKKKIFF
jgi:hypothetical protein